MVRAHDPDDHAITRVPSRSRNRHQAVVDSCGHPGRRGAQGPLPRRRATDPARRPLMTCRSVAPLPVAGVPSGALGSPVSAGLPLTSRFSIDPVPPFRLDLTAWALRRRPANIVDRWDGDAYRRTVPIDHTVAEVEVRQ